MKAIGALFRDRAGGLRVFAFMGILLAVGSMPIHSAWGHVLVNESQKLLASDGNAGNKFGSSVSVSGDVALVGSPLDDDQGDNSGAAYLFRRNGSSWVEEQKLFASDGDADDRFGSSVSVSGDVALVGSPLDDGRSGSAYIFRWNGSSWVEEQKLLLSDGSADSLFVRSVSISGDVALVGADYDSSQGNYSGSAYIFRWNGSDWVEEQKLFTSDGDAGDHFGYSVSVSGDVALVGSPLKDDYLGSAYIFRWSGSSWVEEQKLFAPDGNAGDWFGFSVSVSGDVVLVGAEGDDDKGDESGSAYIFRWNGSSWVEEQKLLASDGMEYDTFGLSVSVSTDVALVKASGSAYIFRCNAGSWMEEQKLIASDGRLGGSVSVSGDVALVGPYIFDAGPYGDLNEDGIVDRADVNMIRSYINQPAGVCPECDVNGDGTIDILDASRLTQFCTNDGCR